MSAELDWAHWTAHWREQPTFDVARLRRQATRKLARMWMVVTAKVILATCMVAVLGRLILTGSVGVVWAIWLSLVIALLVTSTGLSLFLRRGSWQAASLGVPDLLRLTAKRARAGIRLAWASIVLFGLLVASTVAIAALWQLLPGLIENPQLGVFRPVPLAAGCITGAAGLTLNIRHIQRERRVLGDAEAWLRDYTASFINVKTGVA